MFVALTGSAAPLQLLANSACAAIVETPPVSGRTVTLYVTLFVAPAATNKFSHVIELLAVS